jgi:hypothetical protein
MIQSRIVFPRDCGQSILSEFDDSDYGCVVFHDLPLADDSAEDVDLEICCHGDIVMLMSDLAMLFYRSKQYAVRW